MARPHVKPKIKSFQGRPDGTKVEVNVSGFRGVPEEFAELRARAAALATSGVATPPVEVLDNIELGKIKRFTEVTDIQIVSEGRGTTSRKFMIKVNRPY